MISLAIDTCAEMCAAALHDSRDNRILGRAGENIGRGHAERLFPLIAEMLEETGISYGDIERIFCAAGPGSFTGVRVGLAGAQGLSMGRQIPVHGLNTLEGLREMALEAGRAEPDTPVLAVLDARRDEAYCQLFAARSPKFPDEPIRVRYDESKNLDLAGLALCGSGAGRFRQEAGLDAQILHDSGIADIATLARMGAGRPDSRLPPRPIYLRPPDAKPQTGFAIARG